MGAVAGAGRLQGLALSERGFLFDPATGQTYSLNTTATFVLKSLIGGATPGDLAPLVAARFEVDVETADRDAEQFLLQLRELGLWDEPTATTTGEDREPHAMKPLTVAVTGLNATDNPGPGVAVVRAIRDGAAAAGRPVRIVGLAYEPLDPGLYLPGLVDAGYLMPFPSQGAAAVRGRLAAIHAEERIDVLVPTLDSELPVFLKMATENGNDLAELGIRTFLPTNEMLRVRSKARFNVLAETCGVRVPRGRTVSDVTELHRLHEELPYPVFVKGQFYEAYLARTPFDAEAFFHKLAAKWGLPVVVQELIEGDEYDVVAVGDGEGGMVGAVPMRKLQLTDKGKAWGGVTVADPQLDTFVRETMARLRWRGPCEFEVMRSRRDGLHYLIEINPRFPAWVYLSVGAGQNLPWAVVRLALGETVEPLPPYRVGTMFLRHSWDQICEMDDYAAITTSGGFRRDGAQQRTLESGGNG